MERSSSARAALALDHPPELDADLVHDVQQPRIGAAGPPVKNSSTPAGRVPMRIGKAKPARRPAAWADLARDAQRRASSPMSVTHADSPVAMTWLGSHGTSPGCSLASRKAA